VFFFFFWQRCWKAPVLKLLGEVNVTSGQVGAYRPLELHHTHGFASEGCRYCDRRLLCEWAYSGLVGRIALGPCSQVLTPPAVYGVKRRSDTTEKTPAGRGARRHERDTTPPLFICLARSALFLSIFRLSPISIFFVSSCLVLTLFYMLDVDLLSDASAKSNSGGQRGTGRLSSPPSSPAVVADDHSISFSSSTLFLSAPHCS